MQSNPREFHTVVLAALLHDIGKLYQRGDYGMLALEGQHPRLASNFVSAFRDFFAAWIDVDLLQTLVQRHHQNERAFPPELLAQSTLVPQNSPATLETGLKPRPAWQAVGLRQEVRNRWLT